MVRANSVRYIRRGSCRISFIYVPTPPPLTLQTSLVAFQGFFNALVYGSTDTIRDAVAQEPFVERYCKSRAGGGSGLGIGSGGIGGGRDPEDDGDAAGVRLENLRCVFPGTLQCAEYVLRVSTFFLFCSGAGRGERAGRLACRQKT